VNPGWKFERDRYQFRAILKAFLADDKDTLWDFDRAQMAATEEGRGGKAAETRVGIENNRLKLIVSTKTVTGDK
jgi:hypothetical protein